MRIYFSLTTLGLLIAALCGAALSWDAGAILFQVLDQQTPVTPNGRLINLVLQAPVLLASHITSNLDLLQLTFGIMYVGVPLVALLAAWLVVRNVAPYLFVWAALCVGLGMLPGLFNFTAEANMVLQLCWPLFLAVLVGLRRAHVPLVAVLSVIIAVSHPYGIGLLALVAALAFVVGWRRSDERRWHWSWAGGFAVLALLAALRFIVFRTAYEDSLLTKDTLAWSFSMSTVGLPSLALVLTGIAAVAVFAEPFTGARFASLLRAVKMISIGAIGVVLVLWARDPHLWEWANRYTYPVLIVTLIFMLLATVEQLLNEPRQTAQTADRSPRMTNAIVAGRTYTAQAAAGVCALVLAVQGVVWFNLTERLRDTLHDSAWTCVSMSPLDWLQKTPLDQFATPGYALLIQGRAPERVLLEGDGCGTTTLDNGVPINQYFTRSWNDGWFDFQPLQARLAQEQNGSRGCWFALTSGWNPTETDGRFWWRWSDGKDARMQIIALQDGTATLNGQIETLQRPNKITVKVNGAPQTTFDVDREGASAFSPLALPLKRGTNEVQFISQNAAELRSDRPLAMDMANLTLVTNNPPSVCARHP